MASLSFATVNDVKVTQQVLASPPTYADRLIPFQSAITAGSLSSYQSGMGFGTEDSPVFTGLTLSGLTDTRVVLAGVGGLIGGDADLTFSGTRLTATDLTVTGFPTFSAGTSTRVPFFTTAGLLTDSASLIFNSGTGALTATSFVGNLTGTATNATNIGITDDTTTNATMYPLWVTAATGNLPAKVSSTKLSFNPSIGALTAGSLSTGSGAISGGAISGTTGTFNTSSANVLTINRTGGSAGALQFQRDGVAKGFIADNGDGIEFYKANGAVIGGFTSTGLNNTVIGATTRANGSFDVLAKNSGTFDIPHPIKPDTHRLVHSFIEGPRADLIYRGTATLSNGTATVNIDADVGMTPGTFAALARNAQVWVQNESGWIPVRGKVSGGILTITAKDPVADTVAWLVIAERQDEHIKNTSWTDADGRPILEPEVSVDLAESKKQGRRVTKVEAEALRAGEAAKGIKK